MGRRLPAFLLRQREIGRHDESHTYEASRTALFLCLTVATSLFPQQSDFPKLTGPYLGQKPPGLTPEVFAPGIVSKDGDQGRLFFAGDGSEIIYWEGDSGGRMRILSIF